MKSLVLIGNKFFYRSRPARGAWVEISYPRRNNLLLSSRPARGAWVEMVRISSRRYCGDVAPRKGRVG